MTFHFEYSKQNAEGTVIVSFGESFDKKNSLRFVLTSKSIVIFHDRKEILFDKLENFVNDVEANKYDSMKPTKINMKEIIEKNNPHKNISQQDIDNEKAILAVLNR